MSKQDGFILLGLLVATPNFMDYRPTSPRTHPTATPPYQPSSLGWITAKGLHLGVYALLALFASLLPSSPSFKLFCFIILMVHAFATEFLQQWVKERTGSLSDVAIDLLGVALGLAVWKLYCWFRPALQSNGSQK